MADNGACPAGETAGRVRTPAGSRLGHAGRVALRMRSIITTTVVLLCSTGLGGCATWQNATGNPAAALATGPTSVRLVPAGVSTPILLQDPAVEHDSLVGWLHAGGGTTRSATALHDIEHLEVPAPSYAPAGATGVMLGTAALMAFFAVLRAAWAGT